MDTDPRHLGLGPRLAGAGVAVVGVLLALVRWRWWPEMPRAVPFVMIVTALGLIGVGMIRAWRWHLAQARRRR